MNMMLMMTTQILFLPVIMKIRRFSTLLVFLRLQDPIRKDVMTALIKEEDLGFIKQQGEKKEEEPCDTF